MLYSETTSERDGLRVAFARATLRIWGVWARTAGQQGPALAARGQGDS